MNKLEDRAKSTQKMIEDHFFDKRGWLMECLNMHTMKPYGRDELPEEASGYSDDDPIPATAAERKTYEDTMFCTGLYLWSLSEQYAVTGDEEPRKIADRIFDDLQPLIAMNDEIEKGYIGKPWGARPRRRTTLDQTFYFTFGLNRYSEMADPQRQKRIAEIVSGNVDWWMGRNYCDFQYPDEKISGWLSPAFGGAMMAEVFLAWLQTGEKKYQDECERLNKVHKTDWFPVQRIRRWLDTDDKGRKIRLLAMWHHAMPLALWLLGRHAPERLPYWQERFVDHWRQELKLGLRDDGLTDSCVRLNLATGTEEPIGLDEIRYVTERPEYEAGSKNNLRLQFLLTAAKSSYYSTHMAVSAVLMAETVPWMAHESRRVLDCVLPKLDMTRTPIFIDPDGRQWPTGRKHDLETLSTFGMTGWLVAYWQGRRLGLVNEY